MSKEIYFYWNEAYLSEALGLQPMPVAMNIIGKTFSPFEMRSLRSVEVVFAPSTSLEHEAASLIQKTFNKYGVVSIVKNVQTKEPTHD